MLNFLAMLLDQIRKVSSQSQRHWVLGQQEVITMEKRSWSKYYSEAEQASKSIISESSKLTGIIDIFK